MDESDERTFEIIYTCFIDKLYQDVMTSDRLANTKMYLSEIVCIFSHGQMLNCHEKSLEQFKSSFEWFTDSFIPIFISKLDGDLVRPVNYVSMYHTFFADLQRLAICSLMTPDELTDLVRNKYVEIYNAHVTEKKNIRRHDVLNSLIDRRKYVGKEIRLLEILLVRVGLFQSS